METASAIPATPGAAAASPYQEFDEGAFDLWLRRELSRLYDDALREPVPEDLLQILDQAWRGRSRS